MKKPILITLLCAGLMLVTPFIVVAQENKITSNIVEEPDIDGLVSQIRVVINEILQKYGHIPLVSNLCNMIFNSLGLIGNILFCIALIICIIPIFILFIILETFNKAFYFLGAVLLLIVDTLDRNCAQFVPLINLKLPLKTISTFIKTNDIPNLVNNCPCL